MGRPKVSEEDRCCGKTRSGSPCPARARYGDPPAYCANCDPSPEAVARRKEAGKTRHAPGTPEAVKRDVVAAKREEARKEGTLDEIVRRSLALAGELEKAAKRATGDPVALRTAASLGFSVSRLHAQAILALKVRGTVGDLTHKPAAQPAAPEPTPAGAAPQVLVPAEAELARALHS